jgi:hypothetical protein
MVRDFGDVRAVGGSGVTGAGGAPWVVRWDGADHSGRRAAPGLYFAEITAGPSRDTRAITYLP